MSVTLDIIAQGQATNLSAGSYIHLLNSNFGMAQVARLKERGPFQHGQSDVGFRLQPRTIQLVFLLLADSEDSYFTRRSELLHLFAPRATPLQLRLTRESIVRQIDVHFADDLGFPADQKAGWTHKIGVTLQADDPTWYDPTDQAVTFGVGAGGVGFTFPRGWPASFGSNTVNQTRTVSYAGSWQTFPIVIINGPITNPKITNLTTGTVLDLTGTTIAAGDRYTIDCRYGQKTVRDAAGVNRIANLSTASDLATFALASTAESLNGNNDMQVLGSAANAQTEVYVQYTTRYIGL